MLTQKVFFDSWEDWVYKQSLINNNIEKICTINNEKEHNFMFVFGITPRQEKQINSCLRNELITLTNNIDWSKKITDQILLGIHGMFAGFISSSAWQGIYDSLSRKQLSKIIYNNIEYQLGFLLEDVPEFRCIRCKKISSFIEEDVNTCYECT